LDMHSSWSTVHIALVLPVHLLISHGIMFISHNTTTSTTKTISAQEIKNGRAAPTNN